MADAKTTTTPKRRVPRKPRPKANGKTAVPAAAPPAPPTPPLQRPAPTVTAPPPTESDDKPAFVHLLNRVHTAAAGNFEEAYRRALEAVGAAEPAVISAALIGAAVPQWRSAELADTLRAAPHPERFLALFAAFWHLGYEKGVYAGQRLAMSELAKQTAKKAPS